MAAFASALGTITFLEIGVGLFLVMPASSYSAHGAGALIHMRGSLKPPPANRSRDGSLNRQVRGSLYNSPGMWRQGTFLLLRRTQWYHDDLTANPP
jgi:hypothetical protein